MPTTDNGWPASPDLKLRPLVVNGVGFLPGIVDNENVATVLGYVMTEFAARVEPLHNPGCWGFSYRPNRNDPTSLSRHSGGIAIDANAPAHPNGVPTTSTFTAAQIAEVHKILTEVDNVVRWGGDYHGTPDAMHFEIDVPPGGLQDVAARLRHAETNPDPKPVPPKPEPLDRTQKAKAIRRTAHRIKAKHPKWADRLLAWADRIEKKAAK